METIAFDLLKDELKLQTNFAILSINIFKKCLQEVNEKQNYTSSQELRIRFWYYLQNYIVSLGNVSKLLNKIQKLNVPCDQKEPFNKKNYPHIMNRKMRNALEHIDERLLALSKVPNVSIFNRNIMTSNGISINGKSLEDTDLKVLRTYLLDKEELLLYGQRFSLIETVPELLKIRDKFNKGRKGDK